MRLQKVDYGWLITARTRGGHDLPLVHLGEHTMEAMLRHYLGYKRKLKEPVHVLSVTFTLQREGRDEQHQITFKP